jgi:hypothetical protein
MPFKNQQFFVDSPKNKKLALFVARISWVVVATRELSLNLNSAESLGTAGARVRWQRLVAGRRAGKSSGSGI